LEFHFHDLPRATATDQLEDTICYGKVSELLIQMSSERTYSTVEKLGADGFRRVKDHVVYPHRLTLKIHKVRPPIQNLNDGVTFTVSD
jgi:dihydroneopterin aldolase